MKITFLIAFVSCSSSVFGSWVYSQRPYFHWIKSKQHVERESMMENSPGLNLNNLRTASSPSERVVTSRSTSVRQQARQRQPSFSSFFSEGGQDNRARSMSVGRSNVRGTKSKSVLFREVKLQKEFQPGSELESPHSPGRRESWHVHKSYEIKVPKVFLSINIF